MAIGVGKRQAAGAKGEGEDSYVWEVSVLLVQFYFFW